LYVRAVGVNDLILNKTPGDASPYLYAYAAGVVADIKKCLPTFQRGDVIAYEDDDGTERYGIVINGVPDEDGDIPFYDEDGAACLTLDDTVRLLHRQP
jgi:hypothetical protein